MAHGVRHLEQQRPISCVGAPTTGAGRMVRVIPASGRFSCGGGLSPTGTGHPLLPHYGGALLAVGL
jgi:hypothetical protein